MRCYFCWAICFPFQYLQWRQALGGDALRNIWKKWRRCFTHRIGATDAAAIFPYLSHKFIETKNGACGTKVRIGKSSNCVVLHDIVGYLIKNGHSFILVGMDIV